jgi:hypothetical protein
MGHRANKYVGTCDKCGATVPAGAGRLTFDRGRWLVSHVDRCPTRIARVLPEDWPCQVHGPGDDECKGDRCVGADRIRATRWNEHTGSIEKIDMKYVRFLGKLLLEEGGIEQAFGAICAMNEYWDGEPGYQEEARRRFDRALPHAIEQNRLIHPGWDPTGARRPSTVR